MQDEVKVTQAARDAAAEFMNAHGWLCEEEWTHLYGADQEVIVKFFAKFEQSIRHQAEQRGGEVDAMREALERIRAHVVKLRKGTDDWFELVEIEAMASAALGETA